MLVNLQEYHRPSSLEEAVALLRRSDRVTRPIGGGTTLAGSWRPGLEALVDLGRLSLSYVEAEEADLRIGATTILQDLVEHPDLADFASGVLVQAARAAEARNLRNAATVGGSVATSTSQDPFLVALLALDASLTVYAPEARQVPLNGFVGYRDKLLADGALITQISLPLLLGPLGAAYVAVGRTPGDKPIVCAVARMELAEGIASNVRLALGGVDRLPLRATEAERLLERKALTDEQIGSAAEGAAQKLDPPSDFRGSAEYRREMARVLARRALAQAGARAQARQEEGS